MRARLPAILAVFALLFAACQAATPSASAPPASSEAPGASATAAPPASEPAGEPTVLRVSRISDFLPIIHPVELGTGNQELMADIPNYTNIQPTIQISEIVS